MTGELLNFKHKRDQFDFRDTQKDMLLWMEKNWDSHRVFVVVAPTASGKSMLSLTIANWQKSLGRNTAIITPNNILLEQYQRDYPEIPSLMGQDHYMCKTHKDLTCADVGDVYEHKCNDCLYRTHRNACIDADIAFFNYYSYYSLNNNKQTLIIDEAHGVYPMLQELSSITFWDFKHGCNKVNDSKSFLEFLKIQTAKVKEDYAKFKGSKKDKVALFRSLSKYERILDDFEYAPQDFSFAREMKPYKGKMEACVSVRLLSMENVHSRLWAGKTNKIILFSATMLPAEVKMIGIEKMGACYYEAASPIPPSRRMAYYQPVAPMNKTDAATSIMPMLERIMEIANARPNDKGLIHCSYAIGQMLAERLRLKWKTDSRFMVFDKDSKKDVLDDFMNSDKPRILIGAGLSEGLNLVEDLCRFQIITKVMYPNLGDPHVSNLKKRNPKYYAWMAIKTLIQSVGRSTRTENDFSETFILDESFYTLYVYNKALFPKWFQESLKFDLRRANG